ncbi:hypothetical protein [Enterocloster citroniae]
MKRAILIAMIATGLICGCSQKEPEPKKNIEVILDAQQFCGVSEADLIEKMGEPESREEWNYEVGNLYSPIVSFFYDNNRFEFMLNNDKVQRISIHADSYNRTDGEPFAFESKDDILLMFGISPKDIKYAKKVDTNSALRYQDFGNIKSFWIPEYENNSFDEVKIDFSDLFE